MNTDDDLDTMLRTAMTSRPEPPDATNLAARAIATAREEHRAVATTPRISPVARWLTTLAAAIAMLGVLVVGYLKLAALIAANATTSAASSTPSASEIAPTLAVGGIGLLFAIVYLALAGGEDESQSIS